MVHGVISTWWRLCRHQWAATWRAAGFWWSRRICLGLCQQLLWRNAHLKTLALWKSQHPMCRWFVERVLGEEVRCCWGPRSKTTKSMKDRIYEGHILGNKQKNPYQLLMATLRVYLSGDVFLCELHIIFHCAAFSWGHFDQRCGVVSFHSLFH